MDTQPAGTTLSLAKVEERERRTLVRVLLLAVPLAFVIWCMLPNIGPVFRLFSIPATSMAPTVNIGNTVVVSRASYGYSGYSFDWVELPIAGRIPAMTPARGDIVVFRLPRDHATFYVNRVVGLPGDKVQMIEGQLSINGKLVPREAAEPVPDPFGGKASVASYVVHLPGGVSYRIIETEGDTGPYDNSSEFIVPDGHLFMMGDNRDNSNDSRAPEKLNGVGFVPVELVLGRVVAIF